MKTGVAILGLNGSGKSALAHALAKQTGYFEMDVEDYYFPEQRDARRRALDNEPPENGTTDAEIPFSSSRTEVEVEAALLRDIQIHSCFILSGVSMNWREGIIKRVGLAFLIETPKQERLRRIVLREEKRFGARVLPGGDMYERQQRFHSMAAQRDIASVEESAMNLRCPVTRLDGMRPLAENVEKVLRLIDDMK